MTSGATRCTPLKFGYIGSKYPYVVFVGHVGAGKSKIVEKLGHPECQSGDSNKSVTRSSDIFWTRDGAMVICDTPETNPEDDKFKHNMHVAAALTFNPVSRILIVVKADTDMNTVLDTIGMYSQHLLQLTDYDKKIVGAIVTNMDIISKSNWRPEDLKSLAKSKLGLDCILFSREDTPSAALLEEIQNICIKESCMSVYELSFIRLFDIQIGDSRGEILWQINYSVKSFIDIKRQFDEVRKTYRGKNKIDLIFEFQAWMEDKIVLAQNKLAVSNNFSVHGDNAEMEEGLLVTMRKQIRLILHDLRVDIAKCLIKREVDARRCTYCNEVWTKDESEGCEGSAICGDTPSALVGTLDRKFGVLGTYTFRWWSYITKLDVTPTTPGAKCAGYHSVQTFGCGRSIIWQSMPQVDLPEKLFKSLTITDLDTKPNDGESTVPTKNVESQLINLNSDENYVVMIGDVGVGKSTVVEKLTNVKIQKGDKNSAFSVTRSSTPLWTYDRSMVVCDTPGSNSIQDQLEHNEHIAAALNYKPVSRILIIVKADTRIANVMSVVSRYSERLLSLPEDIVGVLVTHMDTVSWSPEDLKPRIKEEFDMECVLFSGKGTPKESLLADIKAVCIKTVSVKVGDENFSKLFKIHNRMVKILRETTKEVDDIKEMKRQIDELTKAYDGTAKAALILQFQSWIESQIFEAKTRLEKSNNFTFSGEDAAKEKGYIANMASQMRAVLHSILSEAKYLREHEVNTDLERYTFKWKNRELSVEAETVKNDAYSSGKSLKATNGMCKPESSEIYNRPSDFEIHTHPRSANPAKKQSLPPIEPYNDKHKGLLNTVNTVNRCNDGRNQRHEAHYERGSVDNHNGINRSHLTITKNEPSGGNTFSFKAENHEISNAGSSKLSSADSDNSSFTTRGNWENQSNLSTETKNLEVEERNSVGDEMDERPLFSFDINVDLSVFGEGRYTYTLKWQNGDLEIVPRQSGTKGKTMRTEKDEVPTKAHNLGDQVLPLVDWPPELWRNMSVSIDKVSTVSQVEANAINSSSAMENQKVKQPSNSMSNERPCGNHKKQARKMRHTKNRDAKWLSKLPIFSSKHKQELGDSKGVDGHEDYLIIAKEEEPEIKLNQCSFRFNVDNKNPDTRSPKLSITFTPTPNSNEQDLSSNNALDARNSNKNSSSSSSNDLIQKSYPESNSKAYSERPSPNSYSERPMPRRPKTRFTKI